MKQCINTYKQSLQGTQIFLSKRIKYSKWGGEGEWGGYCFTIHSLTLKKSAFKKRQDAELLKTLAWTPPWGSFCSFGPQLSYASCLVALFLGIVLDARNRA